MKLFIYTIICHEESTDNITICEDKVTADERFDKLMKAIEADIPDNCEMDLDCFLIEFYDFEFGQPFHSKDWPIKYTVNKKEDLYELIIDHKFEEEIYIAEFPFDDIHCEGEDDHSYIARG